MEAKPLAVQDQFIYFDYSDIAYVIGVAPSSLKSGKSYHLPKPTMVKGRVPIWHVMTLEDFFLERGISIEQAIESNQAKAIEALSKH